MHIGIIDDNAADRTRLIEYLGTACGGSELIDEYPDGESFLESYRPGRFDILFLDQFMDHISGMDVAQAVRASGDAAKIIFCTTSADFAVESYNVSASGYLVKPYSYEQLLRTLERCDSKKDEPCTELGSGRRLMLSHILWCEAHNHNVLIHAVGGRDIIARKTFTEISQALNDPRFLYCFRGCIVNMEHIKQLSGCDFILYDGQKVPVRKRELAAVTNAYADYCFRKARGEL